MLLRKTLGSDPKNNVDVLGIEIDGVSHYLVDTDGDGVIDKFYNSIGFLITSIKVKDGEYLIDDDGDGDWDYIYNSATGKVKTYEKTMFDEYLWIIVIIIIIIAVIVVIFITYKKRNIPVRKSHAVDEKPDEFIISLKRKKFP